MPATPGDGVLEIAPHADNQGEETMPEPTTVADVLNQAFADNHTARMHAGRRLTETNDNISEQTKLMFLEEKNKVGTREAAAMSRMDTSAIAREILQMRGTRGQPQGDGA